MVKPERLLVEDPGAPRELREALEAARARGPGDADMARLAASFGFGLPPSLPPPATPVSGAGAAAGASSAKVGLLLKGAAALGAASLITAGALHLTAPQTATPSSPRAIPSALPTSLTALPSGEPLEPAVREDAEPEALKAPRVPSAPNARSHREVRAPAPSTSAAPVEAPVEAPPLAEPPPSDPASRLREEALLVRRAQSMLSSDPAGALRLTAERRRQFPGGVLGQEASVVAIEALLRLGRRQEAEAQARAFEAAHPGSVHARRMRKLLEGR